MQVIKVVILLIYKIFDVDQKVAEEGAKYSQNVQEYICLVKGIPGIKKEIKMLL